MYLCYLSHKAIPRYVETPNKNIFPKIDILPGFPVIRKIGQFLGSCLCMHQLSLISDHKFTHPLDDVFETEPYTYNDSLYQMNQVYFPEE